MQPLLLVISHSSRGRTGLNELLLKAHPGGADDFFVPDDVQDDRGVQKALGGVLDQLSMEIQGVSDGATELH